MNLNNNIKKAIDNYTSKVSYENYDMTNTSINKSNFDKTYIGKVIGSIKDDNEKVVRWQIFANASTFNVLAENCNVIAVGQRVRMFIPSNQRDMVYAEVIDDIFSKENLIEIVKVSDNEVYGLYQDSENKKIKYKQTITAEGSGNERHNFVEKIEVVSENDV